MANFQDSLTNALNFSFHRSSIMPYILICNDIDNYNYNIWYHLLSILINQLTRILSTANGTLAEKFSLQPTTLSDIERIIVDLEGDGTIYGVGNSAYVQNNPTTLQITAFSSVDGSELWNVVTSIPIYNTYTWKPVTMVRDSNDVPMWVYNYYYQCIT